MQSGGDQRVIPAVMWDPDMRYRGGIRGSDRGYVHRGVQDLEVLVFIVLHDDAQREPPRRSDALIADGDRNSLRSVQHPIDDIEVGWAVESCPRRVMTGEQTVLRLVGGRSVFEVESGGVDIYSARPARCRLRFRFSKFRNQPRPRGEQHQHREQGGTSQEETAHADHYQPEFYLYQRIGRPRGI